MGGLCGYLPFQSVYTKYSFISSIILSHLILGYLLKLTNMKTLKRIAISLYITLLITGVIIGVLVGSIIVLLTMGFATPMANEKLVGAMNYISLQTNKLK